MPGAHSSFVRKKKANRSKGNATRVAAAKEIDQHTCLGSHKSGDDGPKWPVINILMIV